MTAAHEALACPASRRPLPLHPAPPTLHTYIRHMPTMHYFRHYHPRLLRTCVSSACSTACCAGSTGGRDGTGRGDAGCCNADADADTEDSCSKDDG